VRSTSRHNPAQDTLNRHLRPLKLTLAPLRAVELDSSIPAETLPGNHAPARRINAAIACSRLKCVEDADRVRAQSGHKSLSRRFGARKLLILNGEMSEWLKEHAWKAKGASDTERR
jgi:hypothetical protein